MPLSTTGLHEGDFTLLRVLKNNVMQDVLSLTAGGSPDIPLGSLSIAHTAGLQTQLNAKATTAALSAAVESLGGEIDVLETGTTAVAAAVASLGAAVATKAAQSELDATNGAVNVAYATLRDPLVASSSLCAALVATVAPRLATAAPTAVTPVSSASISAPRLSATALSAAVVALAFSCVWSPAVWPTMRLPRGMSGLPLAVSDSTSCMTLFLRTGRSVKSPSCSPVVERVII